MFKFGAGVRDSAPVVFSNRERGPSQSFSRFVRLLVFSRACVVSVAFSSRKSPKSKITSALSASEVADAFWSENAFCGTDVEYSSFR